MNTILSRFVLAALATTGFGSAVEVATTPMGYVTEVVPSGQFALLGVSLLEPTIVTGVLDSKSTTSVVDIDGDFATRLVAGSTYLLEITSGNLNGVLQEFTAWSSNEIQGIPEDFVSSLAGNESYVLRKSSTISSIFGETNQLGLLGGNANTADLIKVPNGEGGLDSFYYSTGGFTGIGWRLVGGGLVSYANHPLVYTDAIFIQRRGSTSLSLRVIGEVKTKMVKLAITDVFQYVGNPFPVGATLGNSGLSNTLLHGNANTADRVQLPDGSGGYASYYYSNGGFTGVGWRLVGGGLSDKASVSLTSGFIINRRQPAFNVNVNPPYSLD